MNDSAKGTPGPKTTLPKDDTVPTVQMKDYKPRSVQELSADDRLFLSQMAETELAHRFAVALLSNSRLEQLIGYNPLSPGRYLEKGITPGSELATHCYRLAHDYLDGIKAQAGVKAPVSEGAHSDE